MDGSGDDATAISLYDLCFELEDNLCIRYSALTPFIVRREKVGEVLLLVRRINALNRRRNGLQSNSENAVSGEKVWIDDHGTKHIRRKAINDDWY